MNLSKIVELSFEVYIINLTIFIPLFFLFKGIFKKVTDNKSVRKVLTWVSTICLTPLLYILLIFLLISITGYYPKRDFDKDKWSVDKETRYEMSNDIINNNLLIDKTKDDVINILGDEENCFNDDIWCYYLGFVPRLLSIDPDVLEIKFKDGKVVEVTQRET